MGSRDKNPMRRGALGKGINSLLGNNEYEVESAHQIEPIIKAGSVLQLPVDQLKANPKQPRKHFKTEALTDLANSIKIDGIIQPIVITKENSESDQYIVIAGERRLRAARLAGLSSVPVIIKEGVGEDLLRLALIENIQRQDLNVIEEAEAYRALIEEHGLTQEDCAKRVGKERSTVANLLRILNLPNEIQVDLVEARLTPGHGRALLALEDKKIMLRARDIVCRKNLNVRQTEALCKTFKKSSTDSKESNAKKSSADLDYMADSLRAYLRTKVKLQGSPTRGKIEISYFSASELERIINLMGTNGG